MESHRIEIEAKQLDETVKKLLGDVDRRSEHVGFKDTLIIRHKDKHGKVLAERIVEDLITNAGLAAVSGLLLLDVSEDKFDWIAIGTSTQAAANGDTALISETHRQAGTGSLETGDTTNDTAKLVATFSGYTGTEAVTEAGVLNLSVAGDLLCRQVFSALNVDWDAGDSIEFTFKVKSARAA